MLVPKADLSLQGAVAIFAHQGLDVGRTLDNGLFEVAPHLNTTTATTEHDMPLVENIMLAITHLARKHYDGVVEQRVSVYVLGL